jgi:hypothetical protein
MEPNFVLSVRVETDDRASLDKWSDWILKSGHVSDVCKAGPVNAEITVFDGAPHHLEAKFRFESREAWEKYEREEAPRLRAEADVAAAEMKLNLRFLRTTAFVKARVNRPG